MCGARILLSEDFAVGALPPGAERPGRMSDGAGRVELVVQLTLFCERIFGRGMVLVLESPVFLGVLVESCIQIRIRPANVADMERALVV